VVTDRAKNGCEGHPIGVASGQRHTISAYRDAFRLLLAYVSEQTARTPAQLNLTDLPAETIGAFLQDLETTRTNTASTRNARLAAIHSFFAYAAPHAPEHAALIQRVLAIPAKRFDRAILAYLDAPELQALLDTPNTSTWIGRRDHALLLLASHTGLRVSELTALNIADLQTGPGPHVRCHGKGRKDRITPLTTPCAATMRTWTTERGGLPDDVLFPTRRGTRLSHDAVERLVTNGCRLPASAARYAIRTVSLPSGGQIRQTLQQQAQHLPPIGLQQFLRTPDRDP